MWDFWFAREGPVHHVFFLQAPRSLGDPELRHWNVTIGHAVSEDLRHWTVLPDALAPSPGEAWDDCTTWTGSVIAVDHVWWMFYTGTSRAEQGLVQRIGAATSTDLVTWTRVEGNPLLEVDPGRYETLDQQSWHDQAWRDPWVVSLDDGFHLFATARTRSGEPSTRGVVAHAVSSNLQEWTVEDPVSASGVVGELEVPQVEPIGDHWFLVFSTPGNKARVPPGGPVLEAGTHVLRASSATGPFEWSSHQALEAGSDERSYGGRVVRTMRGYELLTWLRTDEQGRFDGALSDPRPLRLDEATGRIVCGGNHQGSPEWSR